MKQAVWTGAISFGLVTIPVRLYPATEPKDVRFHLYDRRSGKRVRYERVTRDDDAPLFIGEAAPTDDAPDDTPPRTWRDTRRQESARGWPDMSRADRLPDPDEEPEPAGSPPSRYEPTAPSDRGVAAADIVRGFSLPSGDLVTVSNDELEMLAPQRSRTIDIEEFVDLAEIDPVFFEKTYYVAPGRAAGMEKPYTLLLRAMQAAGMVAIGRFVLRTRPHLVAIRALENALALETLYFGDEVRRPEEAIGGVAAATVSERELKTAQQLIRALATDWIPEKHADSYRNELLELLQRKSPAVPAPMQEYTAPGQPSGVDDLMAALKASVEAAKRKSTSTGYSSATRRRGQRARGSA
ncbi:MAG TPA: Ku protein [Planctomycetota bacterium]|nr:Ku protein [Planctomycetota bacterium]